MEGSPADQVSTQTRRPQHVAEKYVKAAMTPTAVAHTACEAESQVASLSSASERA